MGRRRMAISGRDEQRKALDAALRGPGRLVVVRGPAGIGKSALLGSISEEWGRRGVRVIRTRPAGDRDGLGLSALVDAVRDQFELVGGARAVDAMSRLSVTIDELADTTAPGPTVRALLAWDALAGVLAAHGPTALVIDDARAEATPALRAASRAGCLVVAAVGAGRGSPPDLPAIADTVIDLPPLPADAVEEMLRQRFGRPCAASLLDALRTALRDLAGTPGTVMSTVDELVRAGRLAAPDRPGRGHLCLVDPEAPIALAPGHALAVAATTAAPAGLRLATATAVAPVSIDDLPMLATALGGSTAEYGQALDDLVERQVVVVGGGLIRPVCPALGARLVADQGPAAMARLHRAYAAALLCRVGFGQPTDRAALADHVTLAGDALRADTRLASRLATEAATQSEPARAAPWLRAALRHADTTPSANPILGRLLRILVRAGRHAWLADVAERAAQDPLGPADDGVRHDLAAAAALAALHTGTPVPPAADQELRVAAEDVLGLADWWFTGVPPKPSTVDADAAAPGPDALLPARDLAIVRAVLGLHPVGPWTGDDRPDDRVLKAGSLGDLVTVFEHVLGPRYGAPAHGPLAIHQRLVTAYQRGDLAGVVSAARELDLLDLPATPARVVSRFLAVEAQRLRGDDTRHWLDGVPVAAPYLGLWWWSATGGPPTRDPAGMIRAGVRALASQPGGGLGVELVLARMAELAAWADQPAATRLLADAYRHAGPRLAQGVRQLVRAVVDADADAAGLGADLARAESDQPRLVSAYLVAAGVSGSTGGDPVPWLRQAHEAARDLGAPVLLAQVAGRLRDHGVSPPRRRAARPALRAIEVEIVELIRLGWTNRQIAARVRMSEKTVETYLTRLFARTGCRSRVELATTPLSPTSPDAALRRS